jgi:hypothetical protein
MWLCLNNAFLSIVAKDCAPAELLVRARRKGDIERVFPYATVVVSAKTDYRFRAVVKRWSVVRALARSVRSIDYSNFKDSVKDPMLHDAYLKVWNAMADLQPTKPYAGFGFADHPPAKAAGKKRGRRK